jgi:hypothetical protein
MKSHNYQLTVKVVIGAASLLLASLVVAQTSSPRDQSEVPSFPANFKGEDCDTISKDLKKLNLKKDEFETTADYSNRISDVLKSAMSGGQPLTTSKYFVNSEVPSGVYDADKGSMKVYASLRQSTKVSDSIKYASTAIVRMRSATSNYKGQNAFGATTGVTAYRDNICGVAFVNLDPVTDLKWMSTIDIQMTPEVARRSKGNMVLVYQASLTPPLMVPYSQRIAATLSEPTEIVTNGDVLTAKLERYFVVNRATGEVLFSKNY